MHSGTDLLATGHVESLSLSLSLGDIDRLKEYTLCCFEYLLSKIHGLSIDQLLWEFDVICNNILDADILLVQGTLKTIASIVSRDPMLLAGELILRLKTIKRTNSTRHAFHALHPLAHLSRSLQ